MIEQGVERGADGAASIEYIVHQHNVFAIDTEVDLFLAHYWLFADSGKIVAIQVNIQYSNGNGKPFKAGDLSREPLRQRNATAFDAYESQGFRSLLFSRIS